MGIKKGDEVLLQSFTCVVVANAILKLGAQPVYVDIKEGTYNLDPNDLEKKDSAADEGNCCSAHLWFSGANGRNSENC